MLAAGELAGTVGYQDRWLALAIGLLVVVAAWNAGVLLWGRPRRTRRAHMRRPVEAPALARRYLGLIDRVEEDHEAGRLDARGAHQRLSALVREFVEAVGDVPATTMTLAGLRGARRPDLDGLMGVVESTYPTAFGSDASDPADVASTAAQARAVVSSWR